MAARRLQEMEFEIALTGVLDDIYDLPVRSERDPLERRTRGSAVLAFAYPYDNDSPTVKVVVSIAGIEDATFTVNADFSNSESILESAECCEDLALAIREYLETRHPDDVVLERRWDD